MNLSRDKILSSYIDIIGFLFRCLRLGRPHAKTGFVMLDRVTGQLERYMDLLSARQKLVASNIANADTPGYHTQDIDFQSEFRSAAGGSPKPVDVLGLQVRNDGNDV